MSKPKVSKKTAINKAKKTKRIAKAKSAKRQKKANKGSFVVISTWDHGLSANAEALKVLKSGGSSLDAVVKGCMLTEKENGQRTVGLGGWPDRDGIVTVDAAVMPDDGRAGAVAYCRGIAHPIELARLVMEKTPHVMLVGEGAQRFAKEQGIKVKELPLDTD